jgi:Protein of unknown function (DUF2997)
VSRRIEILIHPDGRTEVRTIGFTGAACKQASQVLEKALGTVTQEQLTSEFYVTNQQERQTQENHSL